MGLALAILFLWLGSALMWVAFTGMSKSHQTSENLDGQPSDVVTTVHGKIMAEGNAYA